jgi:hypothetical protein
VGIVTPSVHQTSGVGKIVVVYLTVNQGARVRFPPSPQDNIGRTTVLYK